jgi:uncharacterized C2H2 Zn-finger protein
VADEPPTDAHAVRRRLCDGQPKDATEVKDLYVCSQIVDNLATIVKHKRREIQRPVRLQTVHAMEPELATTSDKRKRIRRPRTDAPKMRRRELNQGPFSCPYCDRKLFRCRSGYYRHVVFYHGMNTVRGLELLFRSKAKNRKRELQRHSIVAVATALTTTSGIIMHLQ